MSRFVLDSAVTMAWCFSDEATAYTEGFLNRLSAVADTAVMPALWLYEIVNVVALAARKGRITQFHATRFLQSLTDLPIEVDYPSSAASTICAPKLTASFAKVTDPSCCLRKSKDSCPPRQVARKPGRQPKLGAADI